ncbi:MAG: hypothetical protein MK212_06275 [Saprospiraceae bacterium]|nr:hypothetical protein [Saprospiraceae bacterium]
MMKQISLFFFFFFYWGSWMIAQAPRTDAILVGELSNYYDLRHTQDTKNNPALETTWRHDLMKLLQPDPDAPSFVSIYHTLLDNLEKMEVYSDKALKNKLDQKAIQSLLTQKIKTYRNPKGDLVNIEPTPINGDHIHAVEVIHELYYLPTEMIYYPKPKAIGLLKSTWDEMGNFDVYKDPICWVKVHATEKNIDINPMEITWGIHSRRSIKILENHPNRSKFEETMIKMIKDTRTNAKNILIFTSFCQSPSTCQPLNEKEISELFMVIDSINTFEFEGSEIVEKTKVLKTYHEDKIENFQSLYIKEYWIWNDKEKQLQIQYLGMSTERQNYASGDIFLNVMRSYYRPIQPNR